MNIDVTVALRKESVDRNVNGGVPLSSFGVALRKESVDRNMPNSGTFRSTHVALRKESVDRNPIVPVELTTLVSRSPQGERG